MLRGDTTHTLDPKFRLVVPKRISDHLDRIDDGPTTCVLTRGQDPCIYIYSKDGFDQAVASLKLAPFTGEEQRAVLRVLLANTFDTELDGSGRVLVPEKLRPLLGGEREVAVVGNNDHGEIWGKTAWDQYQSLNVGLLGRIDRILGGPGGAT